ncbi:hypothetical protein Tco_0352828 [Tanacetum coccineum]
MDCLLYPPVRSRRNGNGRLLALGFFPEAHNAFKYRWDWRTLRQGTRSECALVWTLSRRYEIASPRCVCLYHPEVKLTESCVRYSSYRAAVSTSVSSADLE